MLQDLCVCVGGGSSEEKLAINLKAVYGSACIQDLRSRLLLCKQREIVDIPIKSPTTEYSEKS